ncbi:MAG: hypothetical protein FJ096_04805 [Deltaproteobacteria bacterium]|nr:hypothetical protein [Deltaproteobacteria bacterium]
MSKLKVTGALRGSRVGLALIVLCLAILGGGCRCARGPVNASPSLRWWLFSNFGASRICPEMLKRGVGLRYPDPGPTVGRFFPTGCRVDVDNQNQLVTVNFRGTGYAFRPETRRVGFQATASVQYRPDFYLAEDDIYVWGKFNRLVSGPSFELGYVEMPGAGVAAAMTPLGMIANGFGNQIVASELTRGFTVLQDWSNDSKSFALGILMPPQKPASPFDTTKDDHYTFANETTVVQANQRDFLGPFEVVEGTQQLVMKMMVQGPPVDVMVVSRTVGDAWREHYQLGRPLGLPPGPVLAGGPLQPNRQVQLAYQLPPGAYYVVIDNSPYAGVVAPPAPGLLGVFGTAGAATLSYVAQLADR